MGVADDEPFVLRSAAGVPAAQEALQGQAVLVGGGISQQPTVQSQNMPYFSTSNNIPLILLAPSGRRLVKRHYSVWRFYFKGKCLRTSADFGKMVDLKLGQYSGQCLRIRMS